LETDQQRLDEPRGLASAKRSLTLAVRKAALVVGLLALAGCQQEPGQLFEPPEGKFTVWMPGTPTKITETVSDIEFTSYVVQRRGGGMIVSYSGPVVPANESQVDKEERLKNAQKGILKHFDALPTYEHKDSPSSNKLGRVLKAELRGNKGLLWAHIYLVKDRWYQIAVVGSSSFINSPNARTFMENFTVLP
jgi:hypothetical protein